MSWDYKLQGDPSQISQAILNQPIETDKLNHIGGFHAATISEYVRQRKRKIRMESENNMFMIPRTRDFRTEMLSCVSRCLKHK